MDCFCFDQVQILAPGLSTNYADIGYVIHSFCRVSIHTVMMSRVHRVNPCRHHNTWIIDDGVSTLKLHDLSSGLFFNSQGSESSL